MIQNLKLYPVFNSSGEKTIKVKLFAGKNSYTACVPKEALPIEKIEAIFYEIRSNLIGLDEDDYEMVDELIEELGILKISKSLALAISLTTARAASDNELWKIKASCNFPLPLGRVIKACDWNEFLIFPYKAKSPSQATQIMIEVWKVVGDELKQKNVLLGRDVENLWISKLDDLKFLDFLAQLAEDFDLKIGVDFAASKLWDEKAYNYKYKGLGKELTPEKQVNFILEIVKKYNLWYLEDAIQKEDFMSHFILNSKLKDRLVVGNELYNTNLDRLRRGIKAKATNGVVIKPTEAGTLSQTYKIVELAFKSNLIPIFQTGETPDTWLADLAIAFNIPIIKSEIIGASLPKFNRLIELWEEIHDARINRVGQDRD